MNKIPRNEHPRPDFRRDNWLTLNGEWDFSIGSDTFNRKILVPFACESALSGIGDTGLHAVVWYRRTFAVPEKMRGQCLLLHFGAVDYRCSVWVNGTLVKTHTGGQSSFFADITAAVRGTEQNSIVVKAEDDPLDLEQPRGKQFWEEQPRSIFYTRTTGIWQSVWLEAAAETRLDSVRITPLFDEEAVRFEYALCGREDAALKAEISFGGRPVACATVQANGKKGVFAVSVQPQAASAWNFYEDLAWTPEKPRLFEVRFSVYAGGQCTDVVNSYFGMRKVSVENGTFLLNNRPYFQKLVLDQGYWPQSLMTAPTDDAFVQDLQRIREMGFNGLRMHQKAEDPRFYYHADRLGLLVWGEIGSAYQYSAAYAQRWYSEWAECVLRDCGHPCIVTWVPLNESWGVQEIRTDRMQQAHSMAACWMTKSLDGTRPVVDNDGWEHTCGDLLTIHDYESDPAVLRARYASAESILRSAPGGKSLYAQGFAYQGQPILVTEFGGICFAGGTDGWGYSHDSDPQKYAQHIAALMAELRQSPQVQGYCYTQLCDIETEQNGLLTYDRKPKVDPALIRRANEG